jgi:hypothetical protein
MHWHTSCRVEQIGITCRKALRPGLQAERSGGDAVGMGILQRALEFQALPALQFVPNGLGNEPAEVALLAIDPSHQLGRHRHCDPLGWRGGDRHQWYALKCDHIPDSIMRCRRCCQCPTALH